MPSRHYIGHTQAVWLRLTAIVSPGRRLFWQAASAPLKIAVNLPVQALLIDHDCGKEQLDKVLAKLQKTKRLSSGLVEGRGVCKAENAEAVCGRRQSPLTCDADLRQRINAIPDMSRRHGSYFRQHA